LETAVAEERATLAEELDAALDAERDPEVQASLIRNWAKWEMNLSRPENRDVVEVFAKRIDSDAPRVREAVVFAICYFAKVPGYQHLAIRAWERADSITEEWVAHGVAAYAQAGYKYRLPELVRILRPILTYAARGPDRIPEPDTEEAIWGSLEYKEFWNAAHDILDALWPSCCDSAPATDKLSVYERDVFRIAWMLLAKANEASHAAEGLAEGPDAHENAS
jgi:hypothetical protein